VKPEYDFSRLRVIWSGLFENHRSITVSKAKPGGFSTWEPNRDEIVALAKRQAFRVLVDNSKIISFVKS
jgi:hypothetical protein